MVNLESAAQEYSLLDERLADELLARVKAINLPSGSEVVRMIREDRDGDHHQIRRCIRTGVFLFRRA